MYVHNHFTALVLAVIIDVIDFAIPSKGSNSLVQQPGILRSVHVSV